MKIYIKQSGVQSGPFTANKVAASVANGSLSPMALAWHEHANGWTAIKDCDFIPQPTIPQPTLVVPVAPKHVTTELTSKRLKKQQLLSGCMMALGLFLVFGASVTGKTGIAVAVALMGLGFAITIITRVRIWWNHK